MQLHVLSSLYETDPQKKPLRPNCGANICFHPRNLVSAHCFKEWACIIVNNSYTDWDLA